MSSVVFDFNASNPTPSREIHIRWFEDNRNSRALLKMLYKEKNPVIYTHLENVIWSFNSIRLFVLCSFVIGVVMLFFLGLSIDLHLGIAFWVFFIPSFYVVVIWMPLYFGIMWLVVPCMIQTRPTFDGTQSPLKEALFWYTVTDTKSKWMQN